MDAALPPHGDDLRARTVSAAGWSLGAQVGLRVLNFAIIVALARLLAPGEFGLVAMTAVISGFAAIFSDVGFGPALIQRPRINEAHRSSVFWLSLAIGVVLMLFVAAAAPAVAWFFKQPALVGLTLAISLDFLLVSLSVVPLALMRRALRFKPIAAIELAAMVGGGALAVGLAVAGAGVWSLAAWPLSMSAIKAGGLWWASDWRPSRICDRHALADLFKFGRNLLGFNVVNYWIRNTDKLLVGRFLSAWALGLYTRSYALMLLPLGLIVHAVGTVMFPAMAAIQHDKPRVSRLYLRTTRAVSLATFPLMVGLFVVADDFVLAILGSQWMAMVPIVRMFCVVGLLESIGALNGNLFLSQGRSDLQFRVGAIVGVLSISAVSVGVLWGLSGVAAAYTIYATLAAFPQMRIAVGLVGLKVGDVLRGLAGTFGCAAFMGAVVWAFGRLLGPELTVGWLLGFKIALGGSVYALLVVGLRIQAFREVYGALKDQFARRATRPQCASG